MIQSLLVCLSVLVAFKITKVKISCIITCDSGGPLLFEFYHMYSNLQR